MTALTEILDKLYNNARTVVDLPGNENEYFRSEAVLAKKEDHSLELVFPPNAFRADALQTGADCILNIEHSGHTVSLIAQLDRVIDDRRLGFTAHKPLSPESLRNYFRVSIQLPIEARHEGNQTEDDTADWTMSGTTLDLSGGGVLAVFPEKPPSPSRIQLTIITSAAEPPIICSADVIRSYRIRKNKYQVAFHFSDIAAKIRDQLISCCLQEQRRQLRENAGKLF